jgi:uncharacterized membrane protein
MEVRPLPRDVLRVVGRALPALAAALAVLFFFAASAGCADDLPSEPQPQTGNQGPQNQRSAAPDTRPAVVARKIKLLYVDGYPRWEYRYLSKAMLRDPVIDVSCLLTSADPGYAQRADPPDPKTGFPGPIDKFPNSPELLAKYDVVLLGDVDPREFSDGQFRTLSEFVTEKGHGLGMIAGPRFSPAAYRSTRLAELLPVGLDQVRRGEERQGEGAEFRPVLTAEGAASPAFRMLVDPAAGGTSLRSDVPPLYWYAHGVRPAKGSRVLVTHPTDKCPDGSAAPLLVVGSHGKGRTMFVAVDDVWRWRFGGDEEAYLIFWHELVSDLARTGVPDRHDQPATERAENLNEAPGNSPAGVRK